MKHLEHSIRLEAAEGLGACPEPEPSQLTSAPSSASAFPFVRIIGAAGEGEETEEEFLAALASFR